MHPSSLETLRTTWHQLSTRNDWALVTDEEAFLQRAKEEMNSLQDTRDLDQQIRIALMRAYSTLLYEYVRNRSEQAIQEIWLASRRLALRDLFSRDDAELLAQETVALVLEKIDHISTPNSFTFWIMRVYQTARKKNLRPIEDDLSTFFGSDNTDERIDIPDKNNFSEQVERSILLQKLSEMIRIKLHNNLEIVALFRCVLMGHQSVEVAKELGIQDYRVRTAKSRAIQSLRQDADFISFLKQLTGET